MLGTLQGIFIPLGYVWATALTGKVIFRGSGWGREGPGEKAVLSTLMALFWPLIGPGLLLKKFYQAPSLLEWNIARKIAKSQELAREIKQAEKNLADVNSELRAQGIDV